MSMRVSEEVQEAVRSGSPVVALETTIVAHGMPVPTNLETAMAVESIIRSHGAIPAAVGMIDGDIVCGLSESELDRLAHAHDVVKAQERDFARASRDRRSGAAPVGATLLIASRCGIEVHVTGGIGGVAPDAGINLDISADLPAIGRYPCITVAAGTKAFMDVAGTLEYLETLGVPVAVWQAKEFPWFYSTSSGIGVEWQADTAEEVAEVFLADQELRGPTGLFLGVPLPPNLALDPAITRSAIDTAMARMQQQGITGKAATPFLLATIFEVTQGASLAANVELIKHNAEVGADVAVALANIKRRRSSAR